MSSELSSRHSPDYYLSSSSSSPLCASDGAAATHKPAPTPEAIKEMTWLCSLIGCALPPEFAASTASAATAGSDSAAAGQTPPTLRVTLNDGRIYSGRLHCVDSRANLILSNASQVAGEIEGTPVGGFSMGHTLIAFKLVKKIEKQANRT